MTSSVGPVVPSNNPKILGQYVPTQVMTSSETKCPFFKLVKRIWEFIKDIFNSLGDLFKPSPNLSEKNIEDMRDKIAELVTARGGGKKTSFDFQVKKPPMKESRALRSLDLAIKPKPESKDGDAIDLKREFLESSVVFNSTFSPESSLKLNSQLQIEIPSSIQDESMRNLYLESQKISGKMANKIYDEQIDQVVEKIQKGMLDPRDILKKATDIGTIIGFEAFRPLYERFTSVEDKNKIDPEAVQSLTWLMKAMPANFQEQLENHILEHGKEKIIPEQLKVYTHTFLKWLKSDFKTPLLSFYPSQMEILLNGKPTRLLIDQAKVNFVQQTAVKLLLECKLDSFMKTVNTRLGEQLPAVAKRMVHDNFQKVSSQVILRIINILETMKFSSMFDSLIGITYDQTNAVIAVEEAKNDAATRAREEIEKVKLAAQAASIPENQASRKTAQEFLKEITLLGKKAYIQHSADEKIKDEKPKIVQKLREKISNTKAALEDENISVKEQAQEFLKIIEKKGEDNFINEESERAVELARKKAAEDAEAEIQMHREVLLNKELQDAESRANSRQFFNNIFSLGEEVYVRQEAEKAGILAYQTFSPGQNGQRLCHPAIASFMNTSNPQQKKQFYLNIAKQLQESLLPQQTTMLLEQKYKATMALNLEKITPYFNELIKIDPEDRKSIDVLKAKLIEELYLTCKDFKEINDLISDETPQSKFKQIILPVIETIQKRLRRKAEEKFTEMEEKDVLDVIKGYLYPQVNINDPIAAQLEINKRLIEQQRGEVAVAVDPLVIMVNNLIIPNDIKKIIEDAKEFAAEMLSENAQGKIKDLLNSGLQMFGPTIEKNAVEWVNEQIQSHLASIIQETIEESISPDKLKSNLGFQALPIVKTRILQSFARSHLEANIPKFAPFFRELNTKGEKKERKKELNKISDHLLELIYGSLSKAKTDLDELTVTEAREYLEPMLIQIENTVRKLAPIDAGTDKIEEAMAAALCPKVRNESDRRLGTLAMNAVTQLGTLGSIRTASRVVSIATLGAVNLEHQLVGIVSDLANVGLQDFRESPHLFVDAIIPPIREKFKIINKEIPAEIEKTKEETDAAIKREISIISRLAYDLLFYTVDGLEYNPKVEGIVKAGIKEGISLFIGSDTLKLEQSIENIYQKLLGNALINENLAIRCQEVIFSAMREACTAIAKTSKPMTMGSMPKLIPSFI